MRYRFGPHILDLDSYELLAGGRPTHLEPQTLTLLAHLIANRHRVVPKEELLDAVWGDRFVSESALTTRIKHLRRAVGDDGRAQRVIRTVHRVGYQFLPEVLAEEGGPPEDRRPQDRVPAAATAPGWPARRGPSVFGRDADLAALAARVRDHRLVTVTGPAGVGKTVLATQLLERGPDRHGGSGDQAGAVADPGPTRLCELASTREPGGLPVVVLHALGEGQHSDADPTESLLRALERRSAVLVLDNCEHLLEAASALVRELLRRCPGVRVVTTSRIPLGVAGESVVALEPLAVDDAVACFLARSTDAGGRVDPDDPAVPELCRRLDCLPLALELAAARTRLLGSAEILELVDDRFRLLRHDRGGSDRHHSLEGAIAWSWDGLAPADQQLLATLTVFAGPFSLEDVGGVVPDRGDTLDIVDALERLVAGSLVATRPGPWGRMRFQLLESVRDFAAARLDDPTGARERHARHFAALAERLDATCQTEHIDGAMTALADAWDNLRAAVGYAAGAGDVATVRRIVRAVGGYADVVQAYEVLDWCEHAGLDGDGPPADRPDGAPDDPDPGTVLTDDALADAMAVRARMLAHRGEQDRARQLAAGAHARRETHATLLSVVWCAYQDGDLDRVIESAPRLVELSRSARGLDRGFAEGFAALALGVRGVAGPDATVTPEDADRGILGALDCMTAALRVWTTDTERATRLLEAVVDSSVRNDHRLLLGVAASTLTQIALPARPPDEAVGTLQRTLRRYLDRAMWVLISADTVMAARLLADAGDLETACRLLGARNASGYRVGLSEGLREVLAGELHERLGERFTELVAEGEHWRPPEAAEAALAGLGRISPGGGPGNPGWPG